MKNKIELKKCLLRVLLVVLIFLFLTGILHLLEYQQYTRNYNNAVNQILDEVKRQYPDISDVELIKMLNQIEAHGSDNSTQASAQGQNLISKYGIDIKKDSLVLENQRYFKGFFLANITVAGLLAVIILLLFLRYNQKKDQELEKITRYIEKINQKNYRLEIDDMGEDELSILKTEVGKTTTMLREWAEHSQRDKQMLKESLSDISHQLKTPLTSITIILDNLVDDPDMPSEVRADFIREIKREITNINFLVQALLKLSKLDSGTVTFISEPVSLKKIVKAAVQNVSPLCDLRCVKLQVDAVAEDEICCDFRWQVEAITNILKNSVEHSCENSIVKIQITSNAAYAAVSIRDFGSGIDPEDMKHLFERFYRGKNASKDSVGIGLPLAKAIVESAGGHIAVESTEIGSRFTVKYFK